MLDRAKGVGHPTYNETELVPVAFHGQVGALYRPKTGMRRGVAVVICPPVGREARCAFRPFHLWASRLAARGFQVLRYDQPGEGDSAGLPAETDQWRAWCEGLVRAAQFARDYTGAAELVVCGLRVGAALALAAASEVRPDGVMLLAPVLTGESWLRDLRVACIIQGAPVTRDGSVEVDGLRLTPGTVAALEQIDVRGVTPAWRAAFLAGPRDVREFGQQLGPAATCCGFEGLAPFFKEAHVNVPPWRVFDAAGEWLEAFAAGVPTAAPAPPPPPAQLDGADWSESAIGFGPGLRGVLCLPRARVGRRAVIIGNTAADPRGGIGSFGSRAARVLAGRGVAVLRMDFAGLGESEASGEGWRSHVYETSRLGDFAAAAEVLRNAGYDDIALLGVCTGGFHAVQAVLEGAFDCAIAINSWLVWRPESMPLEMRSDVASAVGRAARGRPRARAVLARWKASLARRLRAAASARTPDGACLKVRRCVQSLRNRPANIHLLFGRGDAAMRWLEADFGLNGAWLARQPGVKVAIRPGLDHALFSDESQRRVLAEITRILEPKAGSSRPTRGRVRSERRASSLATWLDGAALGPTGPPVSTPAVERQAPD